MANFRDDYSCGQAEDVIEAYLDGEAGEASEALELHLAECPRCAEELALARTIKDALHALPQQRCPERVMAGALEAMESGEAADTKIQVSGGRTENGFS